MLPAAESRPAVPRLFALDVDGTVLTSDHRVTPAVREAVARVRARGVEVVLTTSRPPVALWPILAELGLFEPAVFIGSQGAVTGSYSQQGKLRVLAGHPMPVAAARLATQAALGAGYAVNWFAGERWLVSHVDDQVRRESEIVGVEPVLADLLAESVGPDKLLVISPMAHADRLVDMAEALPAQLRAATSNRNYLEITAAEVDKAHALRDYCAAADIPREAVVAVGDGMNDLDMLAFAGTSVAPANARPEVLAAVHLVTASNDADGVAVILESLIQQ